MGKGNHDRMQRLVRREIDEAGLKIVETRVKSGNIKIICRNSIGDRRAIHYRKGAANEMVEGVVRNVIRQFASATRRFKA